MAAADTRRRLNGFKVNGRSPSGTGKAALIPFFIMHYGIFWVVHGLFVLTLPLFDFTGTDGEPDFGTTLNPLAILFVLVLSVHQPRGVVPVQLHRPRGVPANDGSPADVRAVRSPGRPARHDHRRGRPDLDDRRPGGGDRRARAAQDRARPRAPPGRAPGRPRRRRACPRPKVAARDDHRPAPGRAGRPRSAIRASRPGRRGTGLARRRRAVGRGAGLRPERRRRHLERRPAQRRPPLDRGRRRHRPLPPVGFRQRPYARPRRAGPRLRARAAARRALRG